MLLGVAAVAVLLTIGSIRFRQFDPMMTLSSRVLKVIFALAITSIISYFFGRSGVVIALLIVLLPRICIHAIWLRLDGVNGWTGALWET